MKFTIDCGLMLDTIQKLLYAVPRKTVIPAYESFLIRLEGDRLTLTASNGELTMRSTIETAPEYEKADGACCVTAKLLKDLLDQIPDQPVSFETQTSDKGDYVSIEWFGGNSVLPLFNPDDYPVIPGVGEDATAVSFKTGPFIDAIEKTYRSAASDNVRPILNGVNVEMRKDRTVLVASDTRVLVFVEIPGGCGAEGQFLIGNDYISALLRFNTADAETIDIRYDENYIQMEIAGQTVICRKVVGKYPDWTKVVPKDSPVKATLDREALLGAIKRMAIFSNTSNGVITMLFQDDKVEISANDFAMGVSGKDSVPCKMEGEPIELKFKSWYFVDLLGKAFEKQETVVLGITDPRRAISFDAETKECPVRAILMPCVTQ